MEGELLTSDVVDRRLLLCVQEEVIVQDDLLRFLLGAEMNLNRHEEAGVTTFRNLVGGLLHNWSKTNKSLKINTQMQL